MDRFNRRFLLFLLIILLDSPIICHSWGWTGWFSSPSSSSSEDTDSSFSRSTKSNAEFSIEVFSDKKAVQRLENAKNKLVGPNSCWQNAYGYLMAGCKDMVSTEEQRKRFAWHLSDCFQKESGRPDFPTLQSGKSSFNRFMITGKHVLLQEAFEAKQASMFIALDKLFALHNAMLLESRVIKAFFIYFLSTFVIYMFTSTKQTYTIRPRLYIGLCVTLALEVASLRYVNDAEHRAWVINLVRSLFAALASAQLLHAAFTYRDYEVLNHNILLRLVDKVNSMQRKREISWDEDTDSEVDWKSWIDTDITDDGDSLEDPDYKISEDNPGFTSSMTKRLYHLRPR